MNVLIVVDDPAAWPLQMPGVEVVAAKRYLTANDQDDRRSTRVFNLCRSYRYQRTGYYVSLLAEARGHRPLPSVSTLQDLRSGKLSRVAADGLDAVIQRSLRDLRADAFELSIYFGRNLAERHRALALRLFDLFPAPLLRAHFERREKAWHLESVDVIPIGSVPAGHLAFLAEAAARFFQGRRPRAKRSAPRFDLAILVNPDDPKPPSNDRAIQQFQRAAERVDMHATLITRHDLGRLVEFDALFIRETTQVNHHTFRFAQRAAAEGLIVIDDPQSIVRCTNKVYLAELIERHGLVGPRTLIVHRENAREVAATVGLPCVLKAPDSAFSLGVVKATTEAELASEIDRLLRSSDLIVAQEFLPTDFDWRIGVLDRRPLFVCKYHMARKHWQIIRREEGQSDSEGSVDTLAVEDAPPAVIRAALKATNLIGDGLYGVDLKQVGKRTCLIEINDNPNIDAGFEDRETKQGLYDAVMQSFVRRIEAKRNGRTARG